jgi:hypothetical protein
VHDERDAEDRLVEPELVAHQTALSEELAVVRRDDCKRNPTSPRFRRIRGLPVNVGLFL